MAPALLVTGAAGGVAKSLRRALPEVYPDILWSDHHTPDDLARGERFAAADLADLVQVEKITQGIDAIVHLGGRSVEGPWETVLNANIIGGYNLFEAARRQGVKRVIFASTNHVVGFYPRSRRIGVDDPVRPDSRYGASKAFGEALGALYAYKHGLRVTCLRIGHVIEPPFDHRWLAIWLAVEDLVQLIRIGIEHPDIRHEIFYGMSDNERGWWDNEAAFRFGYRPKHRAEDFRDAALAAQAKFPDDAVAEHYQGGTFCSDEYDAGTPLAER